MNLAVASEQLVQSDISRVHAHTWLQILLMAFLMFYPMQIYQAVWINLPAFLALMAIAAKLQSVTRRAVHLIDAELPDELLRGGFDYMRPARTLSPAPTNPTNPPAQPAPPTDTTTTTAGDAHASIQLTLNTLPPTHTNDTNDMPHVSKSFTRPAPLDIPGNPPTQAKTAKDTGALAADATGARAHGVAGVDSAAAVAAAAAAAAVARGRRSTDSNRDQSRGSGNLSIVPARDLASHAIEDGTITVDVDELVSALRNPSLLALPPGVHRTPVKTASLMASPAPANSHALTISSHRTTSNTTSTNTATTKRTSAFEKALLSPGRNTSSVRVLSGDAIIESPRPRLGAAFTHRRSRSRSAADRERSLAAARRVVEPAAGEFDLAHLKRTSSIGRNEDLREHVREIQGRIQGMFWFGSPRLLLWLLELNIVINACVLTVCFYALARFASSTAFPYIKPWVVGCILVYNFLVSIYIGWVVVPQYALLTTAVTCKIHQMLHHLEWANVINDEEEKGIAGCLPRRCIASLAMRARVILAAEHKATAQHRINEYAPLFLAIVGQWRNLASAFEGRTKLPKMGYAVQGGLFTRAFRKAFEKVEVHKDGWVDRREVQAFLRHRFHAQIGWTEVRAVMATVSGPTLVHAWTREMLRNIDNGCTGTMNPDEKAGEMVCFEMFVLFAAFVFLDPKKKGVLDAPTMGQVLSAHGYPMTQEEIQSLLSAVMKTTASNQVGPLQFMAFLLSVKIM